MFKKFFGDKEFYKKILVLMIPIMIQNGITNFVGMLDNIMVGQVGTVEMNGVAVTNQLLMVFNLCIFGTVSGAGIFGAQFFGKKDYHGVRNTFRFKLLSCTVLTAICALIFWLFGESLINLYLQGEGDPADAAASLGFARQYMLIMLAGILPYSIVQCYSSTLRESGETKVPMIAGVVAVLVNLFLNYILIFGHFGAPALGVAGAAIATVISRFVELGFIVVWCRINNETTFYFDDAYRHFKIPKELAGRIFLKGMPLMLNETLWSAGMAFLTQCYSVRGLSVVGANNISQTFWNVFAVALMATGVSIGIILGQLLGAGETEQAKKESPKLITFSILVSAVIGVVYFACTFFIPKAYNTTDEIRGLATVMMQICALAMPIEAFANATYFTLRSGGKALITFLFDSCFVWVVSVPVAFILSRYTDVSIITLYAICQILPIIKCAIGFILVKKGIWIKNIVSEE